MDIKASDLYQKLKEIDNRIRQNESPNDRSAYDAEMVYVLLEAALRFIPDQERENKT